MPVATLSTLRQQIAAGTLDPVYLLVGPDEVEKDRLAGEFADTIEEDFRAFNVERFYGGETTAQAVIMAARTLPMMAPRRIVFLLHAERLLEPKRESDAAARDLALLEEFVKAPEPHATVVLVAGNLDRRRKAFGTLARHATVVVVGLLETPQEIDHWIKHRVTSEGLTIEPAAVRILRERSGGDVGQLRGDLDRAILYAGARGRITTEDLREVGTGEPALDEWAVTRAIEQGSASTALRELANALDAGTPALMLLGQIGWVVRNKLPARRVAAAADSLFRTDLALKSSGGDPRLLLERLVLDLCL